MKIRKDRVVDLTYLKDLQLSELEIDAPGIENIAVINGSETLKTLVVRGEFKKVYLPALGTNIPGYITDTMDMSAVTNLPALQKLVLGPGIRSIEFLVNLPTITELELEDIKSLSGIESLLQLKMLRIGECSSLDRLRLLNNLKLSYLYFFTTRFTKVLWQDFEEYVKEANDVEVTVEKYKNIPRKRILAIESVDGVTDFEFCEDGYWGNSFSFKIDRKSGSIQCD